uniref:Fibrinogen C-terminal domain-containing protein n=1 Tax=Steinernema glaseri TaxID=37863 RepID=A0A1I7YQ36_9BILA
MDCTSFLATNKYFWLPNRTYIHSNIYANHYGSPIKSHGYADKTTHFMMELRSLTGNKSVKAQDGYKGDLIGWRRMNTSVHRDVYIQSHDILHRHKTTSTRQNPTGHQRQ